MERKHILESLLFAAGHPVSFKKIAEILEMPEPEAEKSLNELADDYIKNGRGLRLVFLDGKVQMVAAPESKETMEKFIKSDLEEDLSPAALETLAIIAYKGPVSRAVIEDLRGVNCSFILRNLAIRGLVEKKNNPAGGRFYVYGISFDFLKRLGLSSAEELPEYHERRQ